MIIKTFNKESSAEHGFYVFSLLNKADKHFACIEEELKKYRTDNE